MAIAKDKFLFCSAAGLCILLSFGVQIIEAAPESLLITKLPGFDGTFPSKHYSGYVSIDGDKNLFYYFVVSERNPSEDPIVLWLNGGPGCSSFDGFVYEHGPFNFEEGKPKGSLPKLRLNPYSWSKVSNIIYLDSPTGVGFSYSKNATVYQTGDFQTAADTHNFLLQWFKQYPEFVKNPFFISGESYAGVYVPTLAYEVVKGIESGATPIINFKGYMVGNAVTDDKFDDNALIPFQYGMGLISDQIYEEVVAACNGNYHNPGSEKCYKALGKAGLATAGLNLYDILEPCYYGPTNNSNTKENTNISLSLNELGGVRKRMFGRSWPSWASVSVAINSWGVPCFNDEVATAYLNDKAVREAIHVGPESDVGPWFLCTSKVFYSYGAGSMIEYHKNLTLQGYRALIFSGDHDMRVPYTGSQAWTRSLGYKIVDEWRSWISNNQVAGYTQGYDHNLTFLTIKGAGHTVPQYKPQEALDFYSRWLAGEPI